MRIVYKGWGREIIFADTDLYAGKILEFSRVGARFSMHFHMVKDETWYVLRGQFLISLLDLDDALIQDQTLNEWDVWHIQPFEPHRLECLSDGGAIIEVSTHDDPHDNYRILPGDSQGD